ncbi:MAG TPA: helix-turn-helix domain-containing protein [Longimicrobiales bacterium]
MRIDAYMRGEVASDMLVPPPVCSAGDLHWDQNYAAALAIAERITPKQPVYDVACRLLERLDSDCTLDLLRTGLRAPKIVRLRRHLMAALLTAGYRTTQIARLLGVSTSTVSNVGVSLRT